MRYNQWEQSHFRNMLSARLGRVGETVQGCRSYNGLICPSVTGFGNLSSQTDHDFDFIVVGVDDYDGDDEKE